MRNMKWVLLLALSILCIVSFFGCEPKQGRYTFEQSMDQIETIEIVELNNWNWISSGPVQEEYPLIKRIDPEQQDEFLKDFLSLTQFEVIANPIMGMYGTAIKFYYRDGTYELVASAGYYVSSRNYFQDLWYFHFDEYSAFLAKYGVIAVR